MTALARTVAGLLVVAGAGQAAAWTHAASVSSPTRSGLPSVSPAAAPPIAVPVAAAPAPTSAARPAPVARTAPVAHKPAVATRTAPRTISPVTAVRAASATTSSYVTGCDGTSGWQRRRGLYAMRNFTYPWRKTGYTIVFKAARSGITGMTYPEQKRIEVYVRSCSRMTTSYLAETIAHEIGHSVDFSFGTVAWERKWQVARHISLSIPWYGAPYATDFATPAGDFAETFAAWQAPGGPDDSRWGRPSAAALKLLIPLMNL